MPKGEEISECMHSDAARARGATGKARAENLI